MTVIRSFLLAVALLVVAAVPAHAAEPEDVVAGIADDGVYVERGASTTDAEVGGAVAAARRDGEDLSIVVLSEEPVSGATTFADAVVGRGGRGLVIVIAPESVGFAGTGVVYSVGELDEAFGAAIDAGGDDGDFARTIVESLTGQSITADAGASPAQPSSSGGSGAGLLIFLVIAVVLVGGFLWIRSRTSRQRAAAADARIREAQAEVQGRIDDVANDLLEMEEEVRQADNARADRFYNEAGETYREASEALATAMTPQALIDLTNRLDVAIWQLDTAEAILDGTDIPDRPEPRVLQLERTASERVEPAPGQRQPRRSSRRSSYGSGSSMMDTLLQMGLAYTSTRSRRSRSWSAAGGGGLGGLFGGSRSSRSSRRARTSSHSAAPRQSSRSRSSRSSRSGSSRRGTGGRVRGGRTRKRR